MVRDTDRETVEADDRGGIVDWSRRNVLKLTGAGVGIAAVSGASSVSAGQQGEGGGEPTGGEDPNGAGDGGDDGHFLADLVDPVFGYPLSSEETDDVDIEHVVDVTVEEGQGAHESFPEEPDPEAPGSFVEIPAEFFFDPVGLHVEPNDLVHFDTVAGLHTVTAFHEKFAEPFLDIPTRVPEGVPGFTSPPVTPGESWIYEFTVPGVYDYFCFPHLGLGMVGRLVVADPEADLESDEFAGPTAGELFPDDSRVLNAEELDPATIVEEGSVAWADLTLAPVPTENGMATETGNGNTTETENGTATEP